MVLRDRWNWRAASRWVWPSTSTKIRTASRRATAYTPVYLPLA